MKDAPLFRIQFLNQGNVYEIYARGVSQSRMFAFVEVEDIVFGERSSMLVDPAEERLKSEFAGVKRTYIPVNAVVRIDEVDRQGQAKITPASGTGNVMPFPLSPPASGER